MRTYVRNTILLLASTALLCMASCGASRKASRIPSADGSAAAVSDSLGVPSRDTVSVQELGTPGVATSSSTVSSTTAPAISTSSLSVEETLLPVKIDTIKISDIYTTHIQFPTDIIYADLSNRSDIDAKIIENAKDVIAIQAKWPFKTTCNLTAMESNGTLRTYIVKYRKSPLSLLVDEKHKEYFQKPDTIDISSIYDSHMVYSTDIKHAHVSDPGNVTSMVLPQSPNILAIKARTDFRASTSSVTVLESEGHIHTYIARYRQHPKDLIMNFQTGNEKKESGQVQVASRLRRNDAPMLSEVKDYPQGLYHIATKKDRITVVCENIFSYSDITYITLRIENHSGVSFEADRTSFVIGSRPKRKSMIVEETNLLPKASVGTLTVAPGAKEKITYSFDKITLSQEQILRVCVYELKGRRDFFLTLSPKDINEAQRPEKTSRR